MTHLAIQICSFGHPIDTDRKTLNYEERLGIGNHLIFGISLIGSLISENKPTKISDMNEISLLVVWTEFRSFDPKNDSDRKILISEKQIGIGNHLIFGIS